MDLDALRVFTIVAQTGSIQAAAKAGAGSRSTVRRKLEELEQVVGATLLRRSARGVELTEAGEVLARRGEQLMYEASVLAQTVREVALNPPRPIRLTVPPGISPLHHAGAYSLARQLWADSRLELRTATEVTVATLRQTDMCVTLIRQLPEGPFTAHRLPDVRVVLLASPDYIETHGPIESVEELLTHPILAWDPPDADRMEKLPNEGGQGFDFEPAYSTDDIHVLHELAAAGLGVSLVPHPVSQLGSEFEFIQVLPESVGELRPMWLLIADAVADSPRIRQLAQLVEEVASF